MKHEYIGWVGLGVRRGPGCSCGWIGGAFDRPSAYDQWYIHWAYATGGGDA